MSYVKYITYPYPNIEVAEALILRLRRKETVVTDFVKAITEAYEVKTKDEHAENVLYDMLVTVYEAGERSGKRAERLKKASQKTEVTANA